MAKVIMTESNTDGLLLATGRAMTPVEGPSGTSLRFKDLDNFNVEFLQSSGITYPDGEILGIEEIKIKLTATDNSANIRDLITSTIQFDVDNHDHYSIINTPLPLAQVETVNLNKTAASYDVYTKFNYLSSEYDEFVSELEDSDISTAYSATPISKQDFINPRRAFPISTQETKKVIVPSGRTPSEKLDKFPFYNEVKITNKTKSEFGRLLKDLKISQLFLASYVDSPKTSLRFNVEENNRVNGATEIQVLDLSSWITSGGLLDSTSGFFISERDRLYSPGSRSDIIKNLRMSAFAGFLRRYASDYFRTFEEIYSKKSCYFEDYALSIEKYNNTSGGGSPSQIFYKPSTADGTTTVSDTQIKYGNTYVYKCKTHYIVVGNSYRYVNVSYHDFTSQGNSSVPPHALVTIINKPQIIIIPVDTFTEKIVTIQPPSIFPQVNFITQNNSKNQVEIYLSPTKGHQYAKFDIIMPSDRQQLSLMELNKRRRGDIYRFETMREDGLFQIFKMKEPPKSLSEFANFKLSEIRMPYESQDAIFKDKVEANTKYFYIFRRVNSKGLVSNPTIIYQVELLIDADESKVIVEEYKIPEPPKNRDFHKFQSLFQIVPAMEQVFFNNEQTALFGRSTLAGSLDELGLGVAEKSIWGRTLKFRIKSTTSGKIIDYNVSFVLTKEKTEEDF
tara:strand:- start:4167 stop:6194 length:2028 start_codon:yes stop_codon:yes gene_type:complete